MKWSILKKRRKDSILCNDICNKFQVSQCFINGSMYSQGFKRCLSCKVWLEQENCFKLSNGRLMCPCCNEAVRQKPRSKKLVQLVYVD